jgi:transcriptional regulator with XRE-family HTH domain
MSLIGNYDRNHIFTSILDCLKSRNISYQKLADDTGLSKSALNKLLTGKTARIDLSVVKKITIYLGLDYIELLYQNPMDMINSGEKTLDIVCRLFEEIGVSSYTEMAYLLNFTNSYVTNILNKNSDTSDEFIKRCASFFKLPENAIIGKLKINLKEISANNQIKTNVYKYPVLDSVVVIVWPEIKNFINSKKLVYKELDYALGENGFFYIVDSDIYFPDYDEGNILAVSVNEARILKNKCHYITQDHSGVAIVYSHNNKLYSLHNDKKSTAKLIGVIKGTIS